MESVKADLPSKSSTTTSLAWSSSNSFKIRSCKLKYGSIVAVLIFFGARALGKEGVAAGVDGVEVTEDKAFIL